MEILGALEKKIKCLVALVKDLQAQNERLVTDNVSLKEQIVQLLGALAIGFVASVIMAFPVKWLWNWLVPEIFSGVNQISALQAWGLVFLFQLLVPKSGKDLTKK
jgi:hypothetical protein